jgi:hypothetical protein
LNNVVENFALTVSWLIEIKTDNASSNYWMTRKLLITVAASSSQWPAFRNQTPCIVHIIYLALGVFTASLRVKGCTMSWEAHQCNEQFAQNETTEIGNSQRHQKDVNARINTVSAMKPG